MEKQNDWGRDEGNAILVSMNTALFCLLLLVTCFPTPGHSEGTEPLIQRLKKTAAPGNGISPAEQDIAKQLQIIGAPAIPYLLPLLQYPDEEVRSLASYTLRDIDGLTEEHLDVLIESSRRGDGWIPLAIARIGTEKAVTFLVAQLVYQRRETQTTWAVVHLGKKAVPQLVDVYETAKDWDDQLSQSLVFVFKHLGIKAPAAVAPLQKTAANEAISREIRLGAVAALGPIGLTAEKSIPELQKLRKSGDEDIADAAASAIINIGS